MDRLALYLDALQRAGLRITEQREVICRHLAQATSHPTPYEVYAQVSQSHPEISRATVYNTLNTLQRLGAIVELNFGAGHTHYDTNPTPHVNLICLHCHRVEDCQAALPFLAGQENLMQETGFLPVAASADILGYCRECRAFGMGSDARRNVPRGVYPIESE